MIFGYADESNANVSLWNLTNSYLYNMLISWFIHIAMPCDVMAKHSIIIIVSMA